MPESNTPIGNLNSAGSLAAAAYASQGMEATASGLRRRHMGDDRGQVLVPAHSQTLIADETATPKITMT